MEEPGRLQSMGSLTRTWLRDFTFTFHFPALEKEMATHSSVLAWRIPGTGEPGGLLSMGPHRVGHDWSDLAAASYQSECPSSKNPQTTIWRGRGGKETLRDCCWECKLVQPLWRTVWKFLRKLKRGLPYDTAILLLVYIPWENHNSKGYTYPSVHCSTLQLLFIYSSQDKEVT